MFDIVTLLFLIAGALLAGDMILIAARGPSKIKPDWKTAVLAGAAGMLLSELLSVVTWQLAAWTAPVLGSAGAGWLNSVIAPLIASLAASMIIRGKFGLERLRAYACAAAGIVPAFLLYSFLIGVYTSFFTSVM